MSFKLSGDLKFLWTILGFSLGASSEYRCLFCTIHKDHHGCVLSEFRRDCSQHCKCIDESMRKCTRHLETIINSFDADRKERKVPPTPESVSSDTQQLKKQTEKRKALRCAFAPRHSPPFLSLFFSSGLIFMFSFFLFACFLLFFSLSASKVGEVESVYRKLSTRGEPTGWKKEQMIESIVTKMFPLSAPLAAFVTASGEKKKLNVAGTQVHSQVSCARS